jgi:hypothetical protein
MSDARRCRFLLELEKLEESSIKGDVFDLWPECNVPVSE